MVLPSRNKFNARLNASANPLNERFTEEEVRAELICRGLPATGLGEEIFTRLAEHNFSIENNYARRVIHNLKLKDYYALRSKDIIPFEYFQKFPTEIQDIMYEYALPGRRVLTPYWGVPIIRRPGAIELLPNSFHFLRKDNEDNPALLFVCSQSRRVALKHYRLWFDTHYIYARKDGGDILFFSAQWMTSGNIRFPQSAIENTIFKQALNVAKCPPHVATTIGDLSKIKRVALSSRIWEYLTLSAQIVPALYPTLSVVSGVKIFESVEELVLVVDDDNMPEGPHDNNVRTPSRIDMTMKPSPHSASWKQKFRIQFLAGGKSSNTGTGHTSAATPQKASDKVYEQIKLGYASVERIAHLPGYVWELQEGEPHYPLSNVLIEQDEK